ncbi:hypothetical protein M2651_12195 [Clostridium sp. SYSU_GA19001]|nr:hypothetical protein [Clostridium caldaquaticum]MCM8711774.1 hypothetical protein [Clostridium caldaquaticum]
MTVLYYAGGIEANETGYNNVQTETQSTTFSSRGIIKAVEDALSKAK